MQFNKPALDAPGKVKSRLREAAFNARGYNIRLTRRFLSWLHALRDLCGEKSINEKPAQSLTDFVEFLGRHLSN